ncbi:ROK family transcriptional regulator [Amycolatopsis plumensis]|uniref:ROK family transcriptional regulator n=2 Tax=Amycolatopsis plumensis TaxID=236508 RepID=A0ABV5UIF5_9PSEU
MTSEIRVLDALLEQRSATRPEIAVATSLSKPAVSQAIRRLEQASLVRPAGVRPSAGRGRSAIAYELQPETGCVAGVDLGGMNIRILLVGLCGERLVGAVEATRPVGAAEVVDQAIALVDRVKRENGFEQLPLLALGVSTPGAVSPSSHRVSLSYNLGQDDEFDLESLLRRRGVSLLALDNNVNCAAQAELRHGGTGPAPTFAFLSAGAGIGMGVVCEGRLLRGRHGAAGEIAYMPLATDPFAPEHRRRGALEDEASAAGMLDAAARRTGWPDGCPQTVERLFDLAASGVPAARAIVAREAKLLAMAISSVCTVIDPDLVVLGGGVGSNPLLLTAVEESVELLLPYPPEMRITTLGAEASVVGAAELALELAHGELRRRATAG